MTADLDDRRAAYLFLALLQARIGCSLVSRLVEDAPEAILRSPPEQLAARTGIGERGLRALSQLRDDFAPEEVRSSLEEKSFHVLTPADQGYPRRLSAT